jgi:zinc D-Ala-D-Ala carboxypeptidase
MMRTMFEALRRLCRQRRLISVPTDPRHKLSANFRYGELIRSQTAVRKGIDNTPGPEQYQSLVALCENVMEPVRKIFGSPLTVTSGFRTLFLNNLICSTSRSQHVKGEAIDFEPSGNIQLHELWRAIVLSHIPFDQCILEFPPNGWIHISHVKGGPQRGKITIARKVNGKPSYDHYTRQQVRDFEYDWE